MNGATTAKTHYGAFNARWLSPEQVAATFVPVPQFRQLVHNTNSLLLGPRGCGKTTLLKMLTRRALQKWDTDPRAKRFQGAFERPQYEAVYIPSDIRWSYELSSIHQDYLEPLLVHQAQRVMVACSALRAVLRTAKDLIPEKIELETSLCTKFIREWNLTETLPRFSELRLSLEATVSELRGRINSAESEGIRKLLSQLPTVFYAHALDAPMQACSLVRENLPDDIAPPRWALCYDELEISPDWLRTELLEALRSVWQGVILKLTWSPLLPSGLRSAPEAASDFSTIRLWSSHVGDPRTFCDNLAKEFLVERFPDTKPSPDDFLSRSILAAESDDEPASAYERGSTEYEVFKELAQSDASFRALMIDRGINAADPVPRTAEEKDQFFRKIKPIALLRSEFSPAGKGRTRKVVTLYAGKEAVYAMSEGNPRWLLGLLNDLADLGTSLSDFFAKGMTNVRYGDQARILSNAAHRFLSQVNATPSRVTGGNSSLVGFVDSIGEAFQKWLYGKDFPVDPIGSFEVSRETDPVIIQTVEQLLELGALIHIGTSQQSVPRQITGSRFRLTFMLAPVFKLPFRTYRPVKLSDALSGKTDPDQLELSLESEE